MSEVTARDLISGWIHAGGSRVDVLPVDPQRGLDVARHLGVSERSTLWAMSTMAGGVRVDHGWLRVLGGGHGSVDLASWNGLGPSPLFRPRGDLFLVGLDVLGGVFALDGGALGGAQPGAVHYFAPDTLSWDPLEGFGYSDWLSWALTDGASVHSFYESLRWSGWESECASVSYEDAISAYPPPFTREGQDLARSHHGIVPAREAVLVAFEMARSIHGSEVPGPSAREEPSG